MKDEVIPRINKSFTNIYGETFDNVSEIAYKSGELIGNLGRYVTETVPSTDNFFIKTDNLLSGVYIYQSDKEPNVAYRIYKEFADYGFNGYRDDKLISKLVTKQRDIQLAKFPEGVITLDGRIIGQKIPFFEDHITLLDYSLKEKKEQNPIKIYQQVLEIIKEMYKNGILYMDNHPGNFLLNEKTKDINVEIIDFEDNYIRFDDIDRGSKYMVLDNFKEMVNFLNTNFSIIEKAGEFKNIRSFDEGFNQLHDMSKKLVKIRNEYR